MKAPTLTDVAKEAGVSYATADRVLNGRSNVSEKARRKVIDAIEHLGYVRNVAAANLSQGRAYRFMFLLPDGPNAFFQLIRKQISRHSTHLNRTRVTLEIRNVPAFSAQALREKLAELRDEKIDGLAIVGLDSDDLVPELQALKNRGVSILSLVSDLPAGQSNGYIGIDNVAAGRTAARLLGMAHAGQPGVLQVLVGDLAARDHSDRLAGFCEVMASDFPKIAVLDPIEGRDDAGLVKASIGEVLENRRDLSAIYSLGAGNSGLVATLESSVSRPLIAVHELVAHSRAALETGLFHFVIDQRPEEEIEATLGLLRAMADEAPPPPEKPIFPAIFVRDNLPPNNGE